MHASPFEAMIGMAERRRLRDVDRWDRVEFVGHGIGGEEGSGFADLVVWNAKLPFLVRPERVSTMEHHPEDHAPIVWNPPRSNFKDCWGTYISHTSGAVEHQRRDSNDTALDPVVFEVASHF